MYVRQRWYCSVLCTHHTYVHACNTHTYVLTSPIYSMYYVHTYMHIPMYIRMYLLHTTSSIYVPGLCRMIDCIHCCRTFHKACVLWHEHIWPEGYQCDACLTALRTSRKDNKFAAKSKWNKLKELQVLRM